MQDFRELKVWQRSRELALAVYRARDLRYLDEASHRELDRRTLEVKRMLGSWFSTLRERAGKERTKGFKAYGPSDKQTVELTDRPRH